MSLFHEVTQSVSLLCCFVKIGKFNSKIVCLTECIIRLILYIVHIIHQKDNIDMDFREMECEDVQWVQLMQRRSVVNMVMNTSVTWEHKTIRLHVLCLRIMETEGIGNVPNLFVSSHEKIVSLLVTLKCQSFMKEVCCCRRELHKKMDGKLYTTVFI
jgi:hypothetical protein